MAGRREMAFHVVAAVVIGSAMVGLACCLPDDGEHSRASSYAVAPVGGDVAAEIRRGGGGDGGREVGDSLGSASSAGGAIRSRDWKGGRASLQLQAVALKHVVARGEEFDRESLNWMMSEKWVRNRRDSEEQEDSRNESIVNGEARVAANAGRRIGKRMVVPVGRRGRSLRTSMRPPYPCSLPPGACGPEKSCCGGACVAVAAKHNHCGRCGGACVAVAANRNHCGHCGRCGGACVAVAANRNHCGRCGHMCSVKRTCCNGNCRRLATDERNCGQCGARCAPGVKCLFGLCGY